MTINPEWPAGLQQRAANHPGWDNIWEHYHQEWMEVLERLQRLGGLREQGYTFDEAMTALGLGAPPAPAEEGVEELKAANQRQHDSIEAQAETITRMQAQLEDITKLPPETREQLLAQAMGLLRRTGPSGRRRKLPLRWIGGA